VITAVLALVGVLATRDSGGDPAPTPTATPVSTTTPSRQLDLLGRARVEVAASSTLAPDAAGNRYDAGLAKDGDTRTAWSEGAGGPGVGESIEFSFDEPVALDRIELINGYAKSRELYRRNGRVSQVRIVTARGSRRSPLRDGQLGFQPVHVRSGRTDFARVEIDGVFGGERYEDTLISEVRFRVESGR
jgi:hypothetical protein